MKHKIPVALIAILLCLLIAASIGVAASLGVFDQFAQLEGDTYLDAVDEVAMDYTDQSVHIEAENGFPEATFSLSQAHYDGQTLLASYVLDGPWIPAKFLDPDDALAEDSDFFSEASWSNQAPYFDYALSPEDIAMIDQRLAEEGRVYFEIWGQMVGDTEVYAGDVRIDALRCNLMRTPEGSVLGYTEFRYPLPEAVQDQAALQLDYTLYRGVTQCYQDETGFYERQVTEMAQTLTLPVTIEKSAQSKGVLHGFRDFADYSVSALAHISDIDVKVGITLTASPEKIHELTERLEQTGRLGYELYVDGTLCEATDRMAAFDTDHILFKTGHPLPETFTDFQLIPFFSLSDAPDDASITLSIAAQ